MLHENCEGWGGLSGTHARRFIESVDHPNVRYLFDIGNTVSYGQETMPFYREILPYVEYVHIKDCRRNPAGGKSSAFTYAGEGDALVREILTDLIARGYKAGVSIEPHVASIVRCAPPSPSSPAITRTMPRPPRPGGRWKARRRPASGRTTSPTCSGSTVTSVPTSGPAPTGITRSTWTFPPPKASASRSVAATARRSRSSMSISKHKAAGTTPASPRSGPRNGPPSRSARTRPRPRATPPAGSRSRRSASPPIALRTRTPISRSAASANSGSWATTPTSFCSRHLTPRNASTNASRVSCRRAASATPASPKPNSARPRSTRRSCSSYPTTPGSPTRPRPRSKATCGTMADSWPSIRCPLAFSPPPASAPASTCSPTPRDASPRFDRSTPRWSARLPSPARPPGTSSRTNRSPVAAAPSPNGSTTRANPPASPPSSPRITPS
ncbi:MAG: hypothetical protein EBV31_08480 [Verrucomicrobia bacterium]|nr:hypothetical protein [Verrucomicrobiota bacterium]